MNPAASYIMNRPEPFRSILMHLQLIIEQTLPDADLRYKWKVPFYYIEGRPLCYLNHSDDYVDVGFWNAAHLSVHTEHLTSAGRKMMRSLRYKTLEEIQNKILIDVLRDAYKVRGKKFWK